MKYYIDFPNYVRPGAGLLPHKLFDDYRTWLEVNVGAQGKNWDWITGDIHARGLCVKRKSDLTAFCLRFKVSV